MTVIRFLILGGRLIKTYLRKDPNETAFRDVLLEELPHRLGDVTRAVSKGTNFPITKREPPRLMSLLIETNGCVDTGEKLGRNRLLAFKNRKTSAMM